MTTAPDPIKVYDARWEEEEFTDDQVRRLLEASLAYGRLLDADTVSITRDARLGAGRVMEIAVDAALRMGFRTCVCADPVSTPQGYFHALYLSQEHPGTMGLTITASHNPANYVGIKYTAPALRSVGLDCGPLNGLTRVRDLYHADEEFPAVAGGQLVFCNLRCEYIDHAFKTAGIKDGDLQGLSLVLDAFNGAAGPELHAALTRAGVAVEGRCLIPDGRFPTGPPNPTGQGRMDAAVSLARKKGCTAVIGTDGDGDRLVFGDGRGILTAGFAAIPILNACSVADRFVLHDPKVNPLALAEWCELGARPLLFRNGHSQIKDYMRRIGAIAAAEESGHYYHQFSLGDLTVSAENSLITILLFLDAVKGNPGLLDDLWILQKRISTSGEFNYAFVDEQTRDLAMASAVACCIGEGAEATTATADGIDFQGTAISRGVDLVTGALEPDWYSGFIRISATERGAVRAYFTAGDASIGQAVENEIRIIFGERFSGQVID